MMGGGMIGDVLSKDDKSITVKLCDGGSKIVFYISSTIVRQTTEVIINDIKEGTPIIVQGQANPDGSVTAQSIQLRSELLRDFQNASSTIKK